MKGKTIKKTRHLGGFFPFLRRPDLHRDINLAGRLGFDRFEPQYPRIKDLQSSK